MILNLHLNQLGARLALAALVLAGSSLLVVVIVSRFVVGTLANSRVQVTRDMLQVPVEYLPNSARLNARLATAELSEGDRDLAKAKVHAQRAVNLSPNDYRFRITLASIEEAEGDRAAAESTLEAARALAPNYWNVHYRLGNLLIRAGKLSESLEELRLAVAANSSLLPGTLDLVWRASRGDVDAVSAVVGSSPAAKLTLAQFLIRAARPAEAASVFGSIDRAGRLASASESSSFLNLLIGAGELGPARALWSEIAGGDRHSTLLWNGGFEADALKDFSQFDWSFGRSEYARFAVDTGVAHSGSRSLRIEFAGLDTTRLDNEIRQLVSVRPGARYSLECYAKSSGLETPEGPKVVVSSTTTAEWFGASEPVAPGTTDWQHLKVDFIAPQSTKGGSSGIYVSIKRKPKFSYDEPTRGIVWFDDFLLKEQ
jgi:tetratricopeptide (TPR) repeat protein